VSDEQGSLKNLAHFRRLFVEPEPNEEIQQGELHALPKLWSNLSY